MRTFELEKKQAQFKELFLRLLPELKNINIKPQVNINGAKADFLVTLNIKGKDSVLICEIKSSGSPSHILPAVVQLKNTMGYKKGYLVIIAPYISQRSAEICRQNNVGFIDLEGNAFLSFGNILIDKRVRERVNIEKKEITEIFSARATRIIRVLLENSSKERWLINDLAKEANVSLGYTSDVLSALSVQGYVEKKKRKGIQLKEKDSLLDRWASVYSFSQNNIFSLYTLEKDFAAIFKKIADLSETFKLKSALTLHSAASLVAPYVARFSDIYLYVEGDIALWKKKLDLRDVERGANLYLISPYDEGVFYGFKKVKKIPIIGNIQLYLDLFKYPARGKEQAEYVRQKLIGF
jgi:hypothetical protein